MSDKRGSRRVPIVTRVEAQAGGAPVIVMAQNISDGGLLLRAADPLPEGSVLHLKFTLPGSDEEIRVTARVQHIAPGAFMGVRFTDLDTEDREAIQKFIENA